ncbi:MAG: low molecular weight phosphotyrosine protein phosphatase [Alphaproteobacteria bacterium]|nr:low molecular weight phosphotyrosine protein phosphatase [Alphaproteobacteria bacterium]
MKILFVCIGNICRSPMAEGVFRRFLQEEGLAGEIEVASAGTMAYRKGLPPDERTINTAASRGIDLSSFIVRKIDDDDFADYDLILAMEENVFSELKSLRPHYGEEFKKAELKLFMDFVPDEAGNDVHDPYYGGADGFERMYQTIEKGCKNLITFLKNKVTE